MIVDNSYVDNRTDLKVQGVLDQVVEWNNAGILDPDWFLNKAPAQFDKAAQGKVGMVFSLDKNIALDSTATSAISANCLRVIRVLRLRSIRVNRGHRILRLPLFGSNLWIDSWYSLLI